MIKGEYSGVQSEPEREQVSGCSRRVSGRRHCGARASRSRGLTARNRNLPESSRRGEQQDCGVCRGAESRV